MRTHFDKNLILLSRSKGNFSEFSESLFQNDHIGWTRELTQNSQKVEKRCNHKFSGVWYQTILLVIGALQDEMLMTSKYTLMSFVGNYTSVSSKTVGLWTTLLPHGTSKYEKVHKRELKSEMWKLSQETVHLVHLSFICGGLCCSKACPVLFPRFWKAICQKLSQLSICCNFLSFVEVFVIETVLF